MRGDDNRADDRVNDSDERLAACVAEFDAIVAPVVQYAEFLRLRQRGYERKSTKNRRVRLAYVHLCEFCASMRLANDAAVSCMNRQRR